MEQVELQQPVARLVPWSQSLSAGSVAPDQISNGKLAGLLSAATVVLAAGTQKIDFSFSGSWSLFVFFFPLEISMKTPMFVHAAAYRPQPVLSPPHPVKSASPE